MKKLISNILPFAIILFLLNDSPTGVEGIVMITCFMILFMASATLDKPTQSPIVWLLCGLAVIIGFGYDAFSSWDHLKNPITEAQIADPEIRDTFNQLSLSNFILSLTKILVGFFVSSYSIWKWYQIKKSEPAHGLYGENARRLS